MSTKKSAHDKDSVQGAGERLRNRMHTMRLGTADVARLSGYKPDTVRGIGRGSLRMSEKFARLVAPHLGTTADWLLTGEGEERVAAKEIVVTPQSIQQKHALQEVRGFQELGFVEYPIVGVAAGDDSEGRLVDLEQTSGVYRSTGRRGAVQVVGSSLEPVARAGQWVLIDLRDREPRDGDLVVAETADGRVLCKRWFEDGERVTLQGVNPNNHPKPVLLDRDELVQVRVIVGVLFE